MNLLVDAVLLGLVSWGGFEFIKNLRQSRQTLEVSPTEAQINAEFMQEQITVAAVSPTIESLDTPAADALSGLAIDTMSAVETVIHAISHH